MEQYTRKYQYIQDYYYTIYELYSKNYIGYPVNYYKLNLEESVAELHNLEGGSYEKHGVGSLSGYRWDKILFFPVYSIDQIQPRYNASEKGFTLGDSENTKIAFPSFYFQPYPGDIVHFYQDFMFEKRINIEPLFTVTGIHPATFGNITHFQCDLKISPFTRDMLEKQTLNTYMYLEINKNVYTIENALFLLRLQKKDGDLKERLKKMYDQRIGIYFQKEQT